MQGRGAEAIRSEVLTFSKHFFSIWTSQCCRCLLYQASQSCMSFLPIRVLTIVHLLKKKEEKEEGFVELFDKE